MWQPPGRPPEMTQADKIPAFRVLSGGDGGGGRRGKGRI